MATITLNATASKSQRIQEAVAAHNTRTGQSLTVKQWIYLVLRQRVVAEIERSTSPATRLVAEQTIATAREQVLADMEGEA